MFKLIVAAAALVSAIEAVKFQIINKEVRPVWIGILGNSGKPPLENGGFELGAGQTRTIESPSDWAGRFWARTWCIQGANHCLTGDCGNRLQCGGTGGAPPVSLAEITLKEYGGPDLYHISLVDGYNIGVSLQPVGRSGDGDQYRCKKASCMYNFNSNCPPELRLNSEHGVLGCKSACIAFDTDEYCCRGAYGTPETCRPTEWPRNYPAEFKRHCPDAYSYAYDDKKSTFTCQAEHYIVTFGGAY